MSAGKPIRPQRGCLALRPRPGERSHRMVLGGSGAVPLVSRGLLVAAQWDQAGPGECHPGGRASVCSAVIGAGPAHPSPSLWARPCAVCQETRFPHEGLHQPGRDR